ncbi:glycosyl hydrolase [Amycolatopsis acidicola]|uniref:Glycosyl hydrolase n=1 Tax=Amycolatopsis acidicola TaxID=2596893 RepID=A0A5N0UU77_9PSEU|nr:glycosyl hydrolase [Amycolatopsis acidicola]KAA9153607.1 glycosyl hydrolase [Amycolatopsis acidicola]
MRRRLAAALLAVLLLVAACSSGTSTKQGTSFAPYVDVTGTHTALNEIANTSGQKDFVLAFVLASESGCTPAWGGTKSLADSTITQEVNALKAMGGSVTVATGGANGTYLENTCTSATALTTAYESVLDTIGTNSLDLDIEQDVPTATVAQALKTLQDQRGTKIMLTLPVDSTGFTDSGLTLLRAVKAAGVDMTVNAMLMNFEETGDWASSLVSTMDAVTTQVRSVWTDLDDNGAHRMLGATLMIGRNDTGQVTTTDIARTVAQAAVDRDLAYLGLWSVNRDNGDCAGTTTTSGTCSGVSQSAYEFTHLFQQLA